MHEYLNTKDSKTALEAKFDAQKIAFGPIAFQAARTLKKLGILEILKKEGAEGISISKLSEKCDTSLYGLKVLLDLGLSIGIVLLRDEKFVLTKTGYFLLTDALTDINMDFVHDVCYQGMFFMDEAIQTGKPVGLKVFGEEWETIYQALSSLPPKVQKSWFNFDHYYSDQVFDSVLPLLFKNQPNRILDVGGNTGKWALKCALYDERVIVTIADLPQQLTMAKENCKQAGFENRIIGYPINLLDELQTLPTDEQYDIIWMSQFLDCFSEEEIVRILHKAGKIMNANTSLYILETYWDRQKYEASAYSLNNTSLYFTVMANGNSRMYHSKDMIRLIEKAGLKITEDIDDLGVSHTLFKCVRA